MKIKLEHFNAFVWGWFWTAIALSLLLENTQKGFGIISSLYLVYIFWAIYHNGTFLEKE